VSYSPAESGFTKRPLTGSASECLGRPSNLCLSRAITTIFVPVTSWKVRLIVPFLLPFQSTINATTETDPAPIADEVFPQFSRNRGGVFHTESSRSSSSGALYLLVQPLRIQHQSTSADYSF
jgi:hypothetical protein